MILFFFFNLQPCWKLCGCVNADLVKVLLAASKKAITRLWYKADPPICEQWLNIVEEIFVMEKVTPKLSEQETLFLEKWEKQKNIEPPKNDTTNNRHL